MTLIKVPRYIEGSMVCRPEISCLSTWIGGARDNNTAYVSENQISIFVAILSTVLASSLLFGAVLSLYVVRNPNALLGMLCGWTVLFAACVGLLTSAKRDQIFAATAAYVAVLVVFVSGNLGGASVPCKI